MDADGAPYVDVVRTLNGRALLAITLFDAEGEAILAETEYEGFASTDDFETVREDVIDAAGREAIVCLLEDITPFQVTNRVRLDG